VKGEQFTHDVGRKLANPFGLHDMYRNVYEWCEDAYLENLPGGADPRVSAPDSLQVLRGGGWFNSPLVSSSAHRIKHIPAIRLCDVGFLVARNSDK
jgi:formylglycine-generating enzyme required for sulfatase activity